MPTEAALKRAERGSTATLQIAHPQLTAAKEQEEPATDRQFAVGGQLGQPA